MARIAIHVDIRVKPGQWAAYEPIIREHARRTLADEPGCQQFDVLHPLDAGGQPDPERVMLHEVYADMAAFEAHRASPRLPGVRAAAAPYVERQTLTICEL